MFARATATLSRGHSTAGHRDCRRISRVAVPDEHTDVPSDRE